MFRFGALESSYEKNTSMDDQINGHIGQASFQPVNFNILNNLFLLQ